MTRFFLGITLVFGFIVSPPSLAIAATDGCPNTWKFDSSTNNSYSELMAAKEKLQGNMVIELGDFEFSNFAGELGEMPKPAAYLVNPSRPALGLPDLYLYGKTTVSRNYSVQVKDCPGKTNFLIKRGTLLDLYGLSSASAFSKTTAKEWAAANRYKFKDYISVENFPACLESVKKSFESPRSTLDSLTQFPYLFMGMGGFFSSSNNSCGIMQSSSPVFTKTYADYLILLELSPGCSWPLGTRMGVAIASGKICEFAIGIVSEGWAPIDIMYLSDSMKINGPISILESFKVTGPATLKPRTINCVKGKIKKKITAIKPVCPTGYKVKT
jgi:hypothetical protein